MWIDIGSTRRSSLHLSIYIKKQEVTDGSPGYMSREIFTEFIFAKVVFTFLGYASKIRNFSEAER